MSLSRHRSLCIVVALLLLAGSATAQLPAHLDPTRVLVVYNQNYPDNNGNGTGDSLEVAQAYQSARLIPAANILPVACSTNKTYYSQLAGWTAFYNEICTPVVNHLNGVGPTTIDTILFCHGVPYQLSLDSASGGARSLDQAMMTPFSLWTAAAPSFPSYWSTSAYYEKSPGYSTDTRHFSHKFTFFGAECYLVARLDGPDVDRVLDLIEGALYGDRYISPAPGYYQGNLYVDTRFSTYPNPASLPYPQKHVSYTAADEDMAWCTQLVTPLGFPFLWENTSNDREIGESGALYHTGLSGETAPDALFYYGWYNYNKYQDVWSWLPGSAASDLNSNSLAKIREQSPGTFLSSAFGNGLTCAAGCIAEPYLTGHPYPEVFIYYLMSGFNFAESAAVSDPTARWRSLYVGDPLYCPMAVGKTAQIDSTAPPVPEVVYLGGDTIAESWRLRIDTTGTDPDLVQVVGDFGAAPLLDQSVAVTEAWRRVQDVTFGGLSQGLFYRAELQVEDPVGNTTAVPEILFINDGSGNPAAVVQSDTPSPAPFSPFDLEFAVRVPGGLSNLQGFSMTIDAAHLGISGFSMFPLLPALPITLHGDLAAGETLSIQIGMPMGLGSGSYVFKLSIATTSGAASHSLTITVP